MSLGTNMTAKARENEAEKARIIADILKNETYTPDSRTYQCVAASLLKMSLRSLRGLQVILVFKITESNELTRKVDKILAK